jgi:hypothetical protein
MAINVEAGVTKRMKLNSQCINHIRISGNHRCWRPDLHHQSSIQAVFHPRAHLNAAQRLLDEAFAAGPGSRRSRPKPPPNK